ncbi:MAG: DUF5665 domain-containing protein [Clostridiales bacterium]|nr:DUF5665 domain-containing protein [Clostridiales bacterium]
MMDMPEEQKTPLAMCNNETAPPAVPAEERTEGQASSLPGGLSSSDADSLKGLTDYLHRLNLAEYVGLSQKPRRLIALNFWIGVARGFGMAVGFTLLGALGIYVLKQLNVLNLPGIGDFIAQILEYVELARGMRV